jgi:hypothetical protein
MIARHIQIAIVVVIVSAIGFGIDRGWQAMETNGYMSCLASVQSVMDRDLRAPSENTKMIWVMLPADESWNLLRGSEVDSMVKSLKPYDCGKSPDPSVDIWGNKIAITLRRSGETVESRVWSRGPDGIERTDDDIVMPYGKEIPK